MSIICHTLLIKYSFTLSIKSVIHYRLLAPYVYYTQLFLIFGIYIKKAPLSHYREGGAIFCYFLLTWRIAMMRAPIKPPEIRLRMDTAQIMLLTRHPEFSWWGQRYSCSRGWSVRRSARTLHTEASPASPSSGTNPHGIPLRRILQLQYSPASATGISRWQRIPLHRWSGPLLWLPS